MTREELRKKLWKGIKLLIKPQLAEQVPVNPDWLTDGEVGNAFMQRAHAITTRVKDITTQVARKGS